MAPSIYTLIGIGIAYGGVRWIQKNRKLQKNGIKVVATVVSTRHEIDRTERDDRIVYYSTVEFTTKENKVIIVELDYGKGAQDPIGSEKRVIYDPKSPEEVKVDNFMGLVVAPWSLLLGGLFLSVWGVLEMLK